MKRLLYGVLALASCAIGGLVVGGLLRVLVLSGDFNGIQIAMGVVAGLLSGVTTYFLADRLWHHVRIKRLLGARKGTR